MGDNWPSRRLFHMVCSAFDDHVTITMLTESFQYNNITFVTKIHYDELKLVSILYPNKLNVFKLTVWKQVKVGGIKITD